MFEFDKSEARDASDLVKPSEKIDYVTGIKDRSVLLWSEHCIECAAPECYETCDLYKARPDERCRRFDYGTCRNGFFRSETGPAAEIVFSRWGKLEARGHSFLLSRRSARLVESLVYALLPIVNVMGRSIHRLGGHISWSSLSYELLEIVGKKLQKKSASDRVPDGFLIEIYNPVDQTSNLKFSCAMSQSFARRFNDSAQIPLPYWKRLEIKPGYNRFFINQSLLGAVIDSGHPFNLSLTPEAESGTHLVFITLDFIATESSTSNAGSRVPATLPTQGIRASESRTGDRRADAKCVVFDLDQTLWEGVLLEGDVTLKPEIPALFYELDQRGILISIASKNNEQEALAKLGEFGLLDYVTCPVINWARKSENIKLLAKKISISTDTFIFIDDSPFEREEVSSAIPNIEVLPETDLNTLMDHTRLTGGRTAESSNRRVMYQQQFVREKAQVEFGDDYLAFLKSCSIVVSIGPCRDEHRIRAIELLQRTNQLNFSGNKYSRDEIHRVIEDNTIDKHVVHCKDKYGDYGLVGFSLTTADSETVTVQDFMLSCRVQGKLIEKAFFGYLVERYLDGEGNLVVNFVSTDRNTLARRVLQEIGFSSTPGGLSTLSVQSGTLDLDFLDIQYDAANQ